MALAYDGAIQRLIDAFSKLPGIGPKGAQRIAFYILGSDEREAADLADAHSDLSVQRLGIHGYDAPECRTACLRRPQLHDQLCVV